MRTRTVTVVMVSLLFITGCGSEFGTGAAAGTGLGALLQNTLTGAKADLEAREAALVVAYNEGVAIGAAQEDLDAIEKEIEWVRRGRAGLDTGEQFLGMDWNDPKETGLAMGGLFELALIIFGGKRLLKTERKLKATEAGIQKFEGTHEAAIAGELHDIVRAKTLGT